MELLATSLTLSAVSTALAAPFTSPFESSYVVRLYESRDRFMPPQDAAALPSQLMTTESGHTFECFLPSLAPSDPETAEPLARKDSKEVESEQDTEALVAFHRAAVRELESLCIEYTDEETSWFYRICANSLIFRSRKPLTEVAIEVTGAAAPAQVEEGGGGYDVEEVGTFVTESSRSVLSYDAFADLETQERVKDLGHALLTQTFSKNGQEVQVQFICSASAQDDVVAAVQWREAVATDGRREIAAFLVESQVFCKSQESEVDTDRLVTMQSLLQPLQNEHTCVTRDEGWWTYEYCFGRSVRQYHRDEDGQLTADYTLGVFDADGNRELERLDSALVLEPFDETHDVSRPAYLELYNFGTLCKTSEKQAPRKAKVFHFCNRDGSSQRLIMVKEMQTCVYTVKVLSPVFCDHPHFLNDEQESDETFEIVHCIPAVEEAEAVETLEVVAE
uniref:MRH domain-containing protein n=1 Tax=Hyaloperonospora arabidopsidis (strain Emoy2) TaxID=559515 RepID=M4BIM3_HYAAE